MTEDAIRHKIEIIWNDFKSNSSEPSPATVAATEKYHCGMCENVWVARVTPSVCADCGSDEIEVLPRSYGLPTDGELAWRSETDSAGRVWSRGVEEPRRAP